MPTPTFQWRQRARFRDCSPCWRRNVKTWITGERIDTDAVYHRLSTNITLLTNVDQLDKVPQQKSWPRFGSLSKPIAQLRCRSSAPLKVDTHELLAVGPVHLPVERGQQWKDMPGIEVWNSYSLSWCGWVDQCQIQRRPSRYYSKWTPNQNKEHSGWICHIPKKAIVYFSFAAHLSSLGVCTDRLDHSCSSSVFLSVLRFSIPCPSLRTNQVIWISRCVVELAGKTGLIQSDQATSESPVVTAS